MRVNSQSSLPPSTHTLIAGQLLIVPFLTLPTMSPQSKYAERTNSLHSFSRLPCEVRWIIWQLSLERRTIEIEWTQSRGFYSRVATPFALRVNRDSRNAVCHLYTLCFGNLMVPAKTLFSFKMDVLLLSSCVQEQTLLLFSSLTHVELTNLQHIAIGEDINFDCENGCDTEIDSILALGQVVPRFLALRRVSVAHVLEYNYEGNAHGGSGPYKIYGDELPPDFYHDCCSMDRWLDDMVENAYRLKCAKETSDIGDTDDGTQEAAEFTWEDFIDDFPAHLCDCNRLPGVPSDFEVIKGPELESVWLWRPVTQDGGKER